MIRFISLTLTTLIFLYNAHGVESFHKNSNNEEEKTKSSYRSIRGLEKIDPETLSFLQNLDTQKAIETDKKKARKRKNIKERYQQMITEAEAHGDFFKSMKPTPESTWKYLDNRTCVDDGNDDPDIDKILHRAPYFMILGAMKAGTSSLTSYLKEHSQVMATDMKEYHFFDGIYARRGFEEEEGIPKNRVRKEMFLELFPDRLGKPSVLGKGSEVFETNSSLISYHDSPRYLFWSDRLPQRIACVTPWIKMIAVLREPIARAFSHYNMKKSNSIRHRDGGEVHVEFEGWVQKDIDDLIETGVLQTEIPLSEFVGSPEQLEAWKRYTRLGVHGPVGRGLYVFQLNEWFQAWEDLNEDPDDFFFVINSEHMKNDTAGVYQSVLEFLELKDEPLMNIKFKNKGEYIEELNNTVRETLQEIYSPYNEELYRLLGTDWDRIWGY